MNWINTLGPWQWLLLAAIPPAILSLYFLKLKRRESVVPSTLLWKKAIEDLHVNSIWQRLRQNILLYLQLLFVALLMLACLRPGWSGMNRAGERRIYVIDQSASMQANDESPNRLNWAKDQAKKLIEDASSEDVAMVIATSDRASVEQGFTNNRSLLLQGIDRIEPTLRTTDIREALRVAAGLANPGRVSFEDAVDIQVADAIPATVYLLSDGAVGPLDDAELGQLKIEYIPVGKQDTPNAAILGFALQRIDEATERYEAFGRAIFHGTQPINTTASLYWNESLLDAQSITLEPGREIGLQFEVQQIDSGSLKLELDYEDALPLDNVAYAAIRPNRQVQVLLVTSGNTALERALQTQRIAQMAQVQIEPKTFLTTPEYQTAAADAKYDLVIYDSCSPAIMPSANTLFFGSIPPINIPENSDANWEFSEPTGPAIILDVNRTHPISQYLEMASVGIVESRTVQPPEAGSVLMIADIGPVFAIAPRNAFQDAVLGFDLLRPGEDGYEINSDWGIKRSFPVFIYAAVEHLAGGVTQASAPTVQPGTPIHLTLSNRFTNYSIKNPTGNSLQLERSTDGRFLYTQTDQVGVYEVYAQGVEEPVERFCVNLFSSRESNLQVGLELKTSSEAIQASDKLIRARQETWRWWLFLALGLLLLEWIVFNRRVLV